MELGQTCQICEKDGRLEGHHLSYEPEEIVMLCIKCHLFLHILPRFNEQQMNKMRQWVDEYSTQWENGTTKFNASEYRKQYHKVYNQAYLDANREKNRVKSSERYYTNRDAINAAARKAYKESPERRLKTSLQKKEWRAANPERTKEWSAMYYAANKEAISQRSKERYKKTKGEIVGRD